MMSKNPEKAGRYGAYVQDLWRQLLGSQSTKKVEQYGQDLEIDVDVLSQAPKPPMILSRLENFNARVDSYLYESAPKIHIVSPVLTIPSLKSFYGWGVQEEYWRENACLSLAHLKEVSLNDRRTSEDVLIVLMHCCKQLESLDSVYSCWTDEVNLSAAFLMALTQCKETLKRLTLFLPDFHVYRVELLIHAPWDLRQLTNLETLSINHEILFAENQDTDQNRLENVKFPHNLPESIEQLKIKSCMLDGDMTEYACNLLEVRKKFNKLKFFELNYYTVEPANVTEKHQLLSMLMVAGMFKNAGIRMSVIDDDGRVLIPTPMSTVEECLRLSRDDDRSDMSASRLSASEDANN
ncbi:hypothetical protein KCV03_g5014, partial [Aureobasidium melanogenum]